MRGGKNIGYLYHSISLIWRWKLVTFSHDFIEFLEQYGGVEEQEICDVKFVWRIFGEFLFLFL